MTRGLSWRHVEREYVSRVFDEVAASYDRGRGVWYSGILDLARGLGGLVLDVGAGTGEVACRLAARGVEVVAVDSSRGMLGIARRKAVRRRVYCSVHLVLAHLPYLPFRDVCFEGVLAVAVLHHVYGRCRRVEGLRELARVIKRGGTCVVTVWYKYYPRNLARAISSLLRGMAWGDVMAPWRRGGRVLQRYYHLYSKRELEEDLRRAGLKGEVFLWDPRRRLFKRNVAAVFRA